MKLISFFLKGLLLYHLERFSGIAIMITNLVDGIDHAFYRRIKFLIEFPVPTPALRQKLWQVNLPPNAPKAEIDFARLGNVYEFSGGHIKNCCFKGAARAALRFGDKRKITMEDLEGAAEEELKALGGGKAKGLAMYS
jgi:ATP-dependent 26S proteasome regulatory subunit